MTKLATVISVKGTRPSDYCHNDDFVYVGRAVGRRGWQASRWANPFKVGQDPFEAMRILNKVVTCSYAIEFSGPLTVEKAVECFSQYMRSFGQHPSWKQYILPLKGKTLGCWCGHWEPGQPEIACHAVVLAKAVNDLALREVR